MFRYLPGLLLVQLVTLLLTLPNLAAEPREIALRAGLPILLVTLLTALWFRSIARADGERDLARTRLEHERERERLERSAASERERLRRDAASEREKIVRAAETSIRREERRTSRRANVKVGLAFASTAAMGVTMLFVELMTLGLLTLSTGGGALGGYLLRWRQTRDGARRTGPIAADPGGEPAAAPNVARVDRLAAPRHPAPPPSTAAGSSPDDGAVPRLLAPAADASGAREDGG